MRRTVITVLSVAAILYLFALGAAPDNGVAQSQEEAVHKGRTYLNGGVLTNGAYLTNGANLTNGCGLVEDRQLALITLAARPLLQGLSR